MQYNMLSRLKKKQQALRDATRFFSNELRNSHHFEFLFYWRRNTSLWEMPCGSLTNSSETAAILNSFSIEEETPGS